MRARLRRKITIKRHLPDTVD